MDSVVHAARALSALRSPRLSSRVFATFSGPNLILGRCGIQATAVDLKGNRVFHTVLRRCSDTLDALGVAPSDDLYFNYWPRSALLDD